MIQKRGNRWRVVVQGDRDPVTLRRRQFSGAAATRAEAVLLEAKLRLRAVEHSEADIPLRQVVEDFWASQPRLAPTTRLNYRMNLDRHVLPVLGDRKLTDIRPRLVAAYLTYLRTEKGLAGGTIRKVRTVLSAVMTFAVAMEYVETNPVMKVPAPEIDPVERVAPTLAETAAVMLAAEEHDRDFLTYLWVAAEEGGRRGETLALRWAAIDLEARTMIIERTLTYGEDGLQIRNRTKTNKPRTVALSTGTVELLRQHRQQQDELRAAVGMSPTGPEDLVFSGGVGSRRSLVDGLPWRPDTTTRRFKRLKEIAKVRPDVDLHGLRHTMVTELLGAGVDPRTVMGRAGHSSETMTMTVYAKVRPTRDAAAAELWGQMLRKSLEGLRACEAEGAAANARTPPPQSSETFIAF